MTRILIVEDDSSLLDTMESWLTRQKYNVETIDNGEAAFERISSEPFDLIILDWELPGCSGMELLKKFRAAGGGTRVLMMTGKPRVEDRKEGLESGADDFLVKPFDLEELSARVRALMRRPAEFFGNVLNAAYLTLNPLSGTVTKNGKEIQIPPKERALLEFFMRHPGEVFSAESLLNHVWPTGSEATALTLRVCINSLRSKIDIEGSASIIENVHGVGYRLRVD